MDLSKAKVGDKFTAEFTVTSIGQTTVLASPAESSSKLLLDKVIKVLTLDTPITVGFKFGGPGLTWEIVHIQEDCAFCLARHSPGPSGYHISLIKKWLDEGTYVAKTCPANR